MHETHPQWLIGIAIVIVVAVIVTMNVLDSHPFFQSSTTTR